MTAELVQTATILTERLQHEFGALAAELNLGWRDAAARLLTEPHVLDRRFHILSTGC
ncbi:hypothetical protein [Amycolatopsis samaneae]|uniref:Uncharacterized protein n=1 Tax=Amycolatopsis samaneae TaxID=664691 RepID=A0ABW5GTV9_9PSEU